MRFGALLIIAVLSGSLVTSSVQAHPEDEFCVPGEGGLDPALCEALSALDSPQGNGDRLQAILNDEGELRGAWETASLYVENGVKHILPGGLDHILFVLALFLSSTKLRALLIQISCFTVAHTVTLAMASTGVVSVGAFVEPLIAASIAVVAVENLFLKDMPRWRPLLVFLFGLLHGLGFAGFFSEQGFPAGQFWSALIGFNIGVEIGQLSVLLFALLIALALRHYLQVKPAAWRRWVVLPASLSIAATAIVWTISRLTG